MKLTQLEYFCVAARYHNITKAAKELFVTQPSISNAIKALEEEFGVNLFSGIIISSPSHRKASSFIRVQKDFLRMQILSRWNFMN